ncbi:type IV secretion system protein [Undibacterium oligocarboniphilum]|nr:type IV secretion system protein [Undibacterium oligocarboniphilum]
MFNRNARDAVEKSQWKVACFVMAFVIVVLAFTINTMLPLKSVKIYRLEVDTLGNEKVVPMSASTYTPSENEVRARLKELVIRMYSINDAKRMDADLAKARVLMSGQAKAQFTDLINSEKPFLKLAEHPDYLREPKVNGVSKISDKVFLIDFLLKDRVGSSGQTTKHKTMTVTYEVKPPTTDEEVLGDNPAGIFVVSFTISDVS